MAKGPAVNDTFIVSNNFDNRPAIKTLQEEDPFMIALRVWSPQGRHQEDDVSPMNVEAVFFGNTARQIVKNFEPGDQIRLSGELKVTNNDGYTNVEIQHADFRYPAPNPNGGGGTGSSGDAQGGESMPSSTDNVQESYGSGDGAPSSGVPDAQQADPPSGGQETPQPSERRTGGNGSSSTSSGGGAQKMPESL